MEGAWLWTGVCWGSGAAGILPLALLQTMEGLSPARLLSFCCCTALLLGWGEETWLGFFFFLIIFNRPTHSILYRFLQAVRGRRVRKESKL